jgi:hypothetical protein
VFLIAFACLTAGKAVLNSLFDDFHDRGENESRSADVARRRGILITELVAESAEVEFAGGRIRFGPAWVEERSLTGHRLVWFPAEIRRGGYRVHFRAEVTGTNRDDRLQLFFVPGDEGHSATESVSLDGSLYYVTVESRDASDLRLSAVRSWKEPRAKNIRFIPKG